MIHLDDTQSLLIITGPNMGGKSTYLRQVAHMSIMAQCGSFFKEASLPLIDRILHALEHLITLLKEKYFFLVEMEETAYLSKCNAKSLVILDEVGRGTSTFDGLALAQTLLNISILILKRVCLFATHYHELTRLPSNFLEY